MKLQTFSSFIYLCTSFIFAQVELPSYQLFNDQTPLEIKLSYSNSEMQKDTDDSTFIKTYVRRPLRDSIQIQRDSIKRDSLKVIQKTAVKLTKAQRKAKKAEQKAKQKEKSKYGFVPTTHMPEVKNYSRNLSFVGQDKTVALIKIKTFQNGDYEAFYDESFKILDSLKTDKLIIDLRNNFGGRLHEIDYLYSYLTDENYVL